ncbi:YwmB family TATA-box binding protein [Pseudalkalibacillus caeni]|uniref:TATA-box binding protein n=1 Tax=Exobacillus caeni TaxID=2574798 RepID=A0A5R9F055_9BACL|nr:YwmB family TATA-box binding protein [Pseudalkalibacillus caeni]TLS35816.1 hypothetical protein FCL54_18545 [Pseudalkalibacillus caeni]
MLLRIGIVFSCVLILFGFYPSTAKMEDYNAKVRVEETVTMMKAQKIEVTDWSLYVREDLGLLENKNGYIKSTQAIQDKARGFKWDMSQTKDGHLKMKGTRENHRLNVIETITYTAYPHKSKLSAYLLYQVKGAGWSKDKWEKSFSIFLKQKSRMFTKNTQIFSCIQGDAGDTMGIVLYKKAEELLDEFSAEKVEDLKEETFVSVSAYNEAWNDHIVTNDKKMNLQIALRQSGMGGKTTVTIGTPIITTEY